MCTRLTFAILFMLTAWLAHAQQGAAQVLITAQYRATPLSEVLRDLERRYDLHFSYSSDFIPLEHPFTASIERKTLHEALGIIFENSPVRYAIIGGQVVLKRNEQYKQMSRLETLPRSVRQSSPVHPPAQNRKTAEPAPTRQPAVPLSPIDMRQSDQVAYAGESFHERELHVRPIALAIQEAEEESRSNRRYDDDRRLAQISLLPYLGTNTLRSSQITNQMSVNLLWGTNGGVDGVEVGGLLNSVRKDVRGVQIAGVGNIVGDNVTGTQVAGLFNRLGGSSSGVQIAGLFNQNDGNAQGVQLAGIYNHNSGDISEVQLAGIYNYAAGATHAQLSLLTNQAGNVGWGQVSCLVNTAKRVNGFQLALINTADTITGPSIGLLNIIRQGYNRLELSAAEYLWANIGLKFGSRKFYNIIHLGGRWDDIKREQADGQLTTGTFLSWGIGYGFGTSPPLGRRSLVNIEAVAIKVNELEAWTSELNWLGQLKVTLDSKLGSRISVFMGPSLNLMWSNLYDPVTDTRGSQFAPEPMLERQAGNTNFSAWVGFQAGMRF